MRFIIIPCALLLSSLSGNTRDMWHAVIHNRPLMVSYFFKHGTPVPPLEELYYMHRFYKNFHLPTMVWLFLEQKSDIYTKGRAGWTALHYAAAYGHSFIVHTLIEQCKADHCAHYINQQDVYGRTALHYALMNGNKKSAQVLMKAQASLTIKDHKGITPAMLMKNSPNLAISRMFPLRLLALTC